MLWRPKLSIMCVCWAWMSMKLPPAARMLLWNDMHWQLQPLLCKCLVVSLSDSLTFFSFPVFSFLSLICCSDSHCYLYISVSPSLFHATAALFPLLLCHALTHTYANTHTLLRLSCGNRPCSCKSWLWVINQGQSSIQHPYMIWFSCCTLSQEEPRSRHEYVCVCVWNIFTCLNVCLSVFKVVLKWLVE